MFVRCLQVYTRAALARQRHPCRGSPAARIVVLELPTGSDGADRRSQVDARPRVLRFPCSHEPPFTRRTAHPCRRSGASTGCCTFMCGSRIFYCVMPSCSRGLARPMPLSKHQPARPLCCRRPVAGDRARTPMCWPLRLNCRSRPYGCQRWPGSSDFGSATSDWDSRLASE